MPDGNRVIVHVGLPKTGTTFLQRVLARNRNEMRALGVLYPGPNADHFFAAQDLLDRPFKGHRDQRVESAWSALAAKTRGAATTVVVSHELLATARDKEIDRLLRDLAPREVTVLATVRDLPRQVLAVWQEDVKNGSTRTFDEFLTRVERFSQSDDRLSKPFWKFQDAPGILAMWAERLPVDRVMVVTVPSGGQSGSVLWQRFCTAIGLPPAGLDSDIPRRNVSLGAAETELLRSVNTWASAHLDWPTYRRLVKKLLAEQILASRCNTPRLQLPEAAYTWAQDRGAAMADALDRAGYPVVGSLDDLRSVADPNRPPVAWPPDDGDQLAAATDAIVALLQHDATEPTT
jgi:hypothetical protein